VPQATTVAQGQAISNVPAVAPVTSQGTPAPAAPQTVFLPGNPSAKAIYDALRNARREIDNQIEDVENSRENLANQLRQPNLSDADKAGLQARLKTVDERLLALDKQKTVADEAVAKQAAVPGSILPDPPRPRPSGPPEEVFALTAVFFFVVLFPLTIAYARRIWRRGAPEGLPKEIYERFTRVEQSLDTIAIETERVGEGQRFITRMLSQQADRALGAGAAEHIDAGSREKARDLRK
jgi:hypothetical protein